MDSKKTIAPEGTSQTAQTPLLNAPNPLADLPQPLPESGDRAAISALPAISNAAPLTDLAAPSMNNGAPPLPPDLNLPVPLLPSALPSNSTSKVTSLPEVNVVNDTPKRKTWQTVLAPTVIPTHTNFNYKRVVQPGSIYRTQYDAANRHLPSALNREDYIALLFARVAANDVEATRALLNTGLSPSVTDDAGQTPLSIARRAGANDTARLLIARGATS